MHLCKNYLRIKLSMPLERIGKHDDWKIPIRVARNKDDDFSA